MKIEINNTEFTISNRIISYEDEATGEIEVINLDNRDGQLSFAALNVDYDIEEFENHLTTDDMELARQDCKSNYWGAVKSGEGTEEIKGN